MNQEKKEKICTCGDEKKVVVPNEMVTTTAVFLLILFAAFLAVGFWAGRWITLEQLTHQLEEERFSDSIETRFYTESDYDDATDQQDNVMLRNEVDEENQDEGVQLPNIDVSSNFETEGQQGEQLFYAELAGFRSLVAAQSFEKRLINKKIPVYTKKKISRDARGRSIEWYQVVTKPYVVEDDLKKIVARVVREEYLKGDIPIMTYTKEYRAE